MSSPAVEALRAELLAQKAELEPQLRGARNMVNDPFSPEGTAALNVRISRLERRLNVINANLSGFNDLDTDGYPDLPDAEVPAAVLAEFERKEADVGKAVDGFAAVGQAVGGEVTLPEPTPKQP